MTTTTTTTTNPTLERRRRDRHRRTARRLMGQMRAGAVLQVHHRPGGRVWTLSNGMPVPDEVAKLVIAHMQIVANGDGVFGGAGPAQTYRFTSTISIPQTNER